MTATPSIGIPEAARQEVAALATVAEDTDQVSTDLLTRRLDVHEKTAWMLRSLLA